MPIVLEGMNFVKDHQKDSYQNKIDEGKTKKIKTY